jgi:hypothetical protein
VAESGRTRREARRTGHPLYAVGEGDLLGPSLHTAAGVGTHAAVHPNGSTPMVRLRPAGRAVGSCARGRPAEASSHCLLPRHQVLEEDCPLPLR